MRKLFENINGNSFKTIKESNLSDPSKDEMLEYLRNSYGNEEGFEDDAEIAMYWFANFYHGGQSSHLYSVLSNSRFHPGPIAKGPEPHSSEEMMYEDLVLKFAPGSEETIEIQKKHNSLNENEFDGYKLPKHNAKVSSQELAEANEVAKKIWGDGVTAQFHSIDRLGGKHFHVKSFGGHPANKTGYICKEKSGKWTYSVGEGEHSRWVSLNEAVSPKNQTLIEKWIKEHGARKTAYKMVNSVVRQRTGMDIEDMADTATLSHGLDTIEASLNSGNFEQALKDAFQAAKDFFDEEAGEGIFEGDEADAANDAWAGSDDDLKAHGFAGEMKKYNKVLHPKQKSKKFFNGTNKPKKTVQDFDWQRIKQNIDKGTLKEWGESEQVIYKDRQGGQDVYWMDNKDTGGKIQVRPEAVQKLIKRGHRLVDLQDVNEETTNGGTPSLIDGQSNSVAAGRVNKVLAELSKGMFSDQSWDAVNKIFEKLGKLGLEVTILSAKYGGQQDTSNGMAKYKEWQISIPFTNKVGKPMELVGQITAHGAGSVEQPLDRYDITAYVSAIPKRG